MCAMAPLDVHAARARASAHVLTFAGKKSQQHCVGCKAAPRRMQCMPRQPAWVWLSGRQFGGWCFDRKSRLRLPPGGHMTTRTRPNWQVRRFVKLNKMTSRPSPGGCPEAFIATGLCCGNSLCCRLCCIECSCGMSKPQGVLCQVFLPCRW